MSRGVFSTFSDIYWEGKEGLDGGNGGAGFMLWVC
jgi:predicted secreted hydrolase